MEDRAAGHLQHGDWSSLFGFTVLRELFGRKLIRVECIRTGGRIADRRAAAAQRILEDAEIESRGLVVGNALRSRDRLARRNPPNPVSARDGADLEIRIFVFQLE